MSNILNTINFLAENPEKRFIRITDVNSNLQVGSVKDIYLKDIPNNDLAVYIKNNVPNPNIQSFVMVELRYHSGATTKKANAFPVQIEPDKIPVQQPMNNLPVTAPAPAPTYEAVPISHNGMLSVPFTEVMKANKNESKVENLIEKIEELKEDKAELKEKIKRKDKKIDDLDSQLRDAKSTLSVAEAQKNMAVMMAEMKNKSFLETINFDKLLDKAPEIMGQVANMKHGNSTAGALGTPGLSETKKECVDYIIEELNDNEVAYLGSVCRNLSNPVFIQQLTQLISTHNGK